MISVHPEVTALLFVAQWLAGMPFSIICMCNCTCIRFKLHWYWLQLVSISNCTAIRCTTKLQECHFPMAGGNARLCGLRQILVQAHSHRLYLAQPRTQPLHFNSLYGDATAFYPLIWGCNCILPFTWGCNGQRGYVYALPSLLLFLKSRELCKTVAWVFCKGSILSLSRAKLLTTMHFVFRWVHVYPIGQTHKCVNNPGASQT